MANSEEERYSLEDILLEFKQPEDQDIQKRTAVETPPEAERAPAPAAEQSKPAAEHLSEEEMRSQEAALAARMRARHAKEDKSAPSAEKKPQPRRTEDDIAAHSAQIKQEKDALPPEERKTGHGQITMKFPAVKEMARQADEAPQKPEEPRTEPLNFAAFTKREAPPRKAPPPPI